MDIVLLLTVCGIAALDSINPSALLVTFVLLSRPNYAKNITAYVAGILITYFTLGIALLLGFNKLPTATDIAAHPTLLIAELIVGIGLLIYSFFIKPNRHGSILDRLKGRTGFFALLSLGSLVTLIEFTTALPYLGAIGMLTTSGIDTSQQLLLLAAYNIIFIIPPVLVVCAYGLLGSTIKQRFITWRNAIQKNGNGAWPWIVGIIGFLIARDAVMQLLLYFKVVTLHGS